MTEIAVAFHSIRKTFHTREAIVTALENVTVELPVNSFTALVGPSGCGKSTLLHIAAGLDTQFEGRLALREGSTRQACLFQAPRLLPWLTAVENVAFVREARGEPRAKALEAARKYLHLVGLGDNESRYPNHLSGGMQQRVAMARALAIEPQIMLMDEPFSALDELTARRLRAELVELCRRSPRTVLFVTHNVTEAAYLADRVLVMSARPGRIVADIAVTLPRPRDYDDPKIATTAREIMRSLDAPIPSEAAAKHVTPGIAADGKKWEKDDDAIQEAYRRTSLGPFH
jgi:ABC-type nitrate/sulfonate/bicarbonate transport system ATPase subunit